MADFTRRIPDCNDDCEGERGERGERGKRGHEGPPGPPGPPGPTGPVEADNITIVGDGTPASPLVARQLATYVYRPGATGVNAPGGNVFTDWYALMAEIRATAKLGYRYIQFDNTFAPNPNTDPQVQAFAAFNTILAAPQQPGGKWPAAILPPPQGESWDMLDVIWTDRGGAPGLDTSYVQIYDGGPNQPNHIDNLKRIDSMIMGIIYNGITPGNAPFRVSRSTNLAGQPAPFYGWVFEGVRLRLCNTSATGPGGLPTQPLWISDVGTSFFDVQNNAVLGISPYAPATTANPVASPAPIIDVDAGAILTIFGKRTTSIGDGSFVGAGHIGIDTYFSEVWGSSESPLFRWVQPAFTGTVGGPTGPGTPMQYTCATQRFRPSSTVLTADGNAFFGEVCKVDSSNNAVTVTLPKASFAAVGPSGDFPWEGTAIVVLDVANPPGNFPITVVCHPTDAINGVPGGGVIIPIAAPIPGQFTQRSLRFWPDRTTTKDDGHWFTTE